MFEIEGTPVGCVGLERSFAGRAGNAAARLVVAADGGERLLGRLGDEISRPGSKKASRPSHQSLRIGAPHAAASNNRPEGQWPIAAIAARVTFSVRREELKKAGWSSGGTWLT